MTKEHRPEFLRRLVALGEIFDKKLSPQQQALYFEALADLPMDAVVLAMNQATKLCQFFPRPVELRQFALGDSEDHAELAWVTFRKAMKQTGSYASLLVEDAALGEAIVAMFGSWPQACVAELSPEMWASKRKEFARVYRVMCNRQLDGTRYLAGICEQTNAGRKDWMAHVPVHALERSGNVRALPARDAETAKLAAASTAHELSRLRDDLPKLLKLVPKSEETA